MTKSSVYVSQSGFAWKDENCTIVRKRQIDG